METPGDPMEPKDEASRSGESELAKKVAERPQSEVTSIDFKSLLRQLQLWMAGLIIPAPVTLGALVLAAFLAFPAVKGFRSGSTIRQLEQKTLELQQSLDAVRSRAIQLERNLSERDIRLSQRQTSREVGRSGMYISPLLFLDRKKQDTPDLINIDFTQAEQAILVFPLPRFELQDIEIIIYQDARLVWNQIIAIPREKLFNQHLVTFLLTRSNLAPGTYRIVVEGNPAGKRVVLNEFDLAIEG